MSENHELDMSCNDMPERQSVLTEQLLSVFQSELDKLKNADIETRQNLYEMAEKLGIKIIKGDY